MTHHAKTFALLDVELPKSDVRFPDLPPAMADWFEREGAIRVLEAHRHGDAVLHPEDMRRHNDGERILLDFLHENQNQAIWSAVLDGSDDPLVVIREDPDAAETAWQDTGLTFSSFIYAQIFDWQHFRDRDSIVFWDYRTPALKDHLASAFTAEPVSHSYPDIDVLRFSRGDQRVVIQRHGDHDRWFLMAPEDEARDELVEELEALVPS